MQTLAVWRLNYLDALRGVAIIQVLLSSYLAAFDPGLFPDPGRAHVSLTSLVLGVATDGNAGICMFFAISGFTMTTSFNTPWWRIGRAIFARIVRLAIPTIAAIGLGLLATELLPRAAWLGYRWSGLPLLDSLHPSLPTGRSVMLDGLGAVLGYSGTSELGELLTTKLAIPLIPGQSHNPALWCCCFQLAGSLLVILLMMARRISQMLWAILLLGALAVTMATPIAAMLAGHALACSRFARQPRLPAAFAVMGLWFGFRFCLFPEPAFANLATFLTRSLWFTNYTGTQANIDQASNVAGVILVFAAFALCPWLQRVIGASGLDRVGRVSLPLYLVHLPALTIAASLTVRRLTEIQPDQQPTIIALLALVAAAAAGWIFLLIDRVARAASRDIATGLAWHADPRVTVLPPARSAGPKSPQGWTR